MQLNLVLTTLLALAGTTLASPAPKPTKKCTTTVKVTETATGTTTVYETLAAVPREIVCGDCDLLVKTIYKGGHSAKPTKTVTKKSTLIYIPICTVLPTAEPVPEPEPTVTRCTTAYTVTKSFPLTTTVYKTLAAIPDELDCKGCDLIFETQFFGTSVKPTKTVTLESTLTRIPICGLPLQTGA
ncbi:hypothetical protein ABW20_dc0102453 [Dactylellina cionopaga]|nr:hypothetical protein ABW20_dc0102453 [Dactylellina cionopaga]